MIEYRVIKPGLMTFGRIGKYVSHLNGDLIILEFPNGKELTYRETSLERVDRSRQADAPEYWIVVKEESKDKTGVRPKRYKHHESEEEARNEAIRLARANPGHRFRYYKQCGCVEYKPVTTHELVETK